MGIWGQDLRDVFGIAVNACCSTATNKQCVKLTTYQCVHRLEAYATIGYLQDEHRITIAEKAVFFIYGFSVGTLE